jgi:hypothetical protein
MFIRNGTSGRFDVTDEDQARLSRCGCTRPGQRSHDRAADHALSTMSDMVVAHLPIEVAGSVLPGRDDPGRVAGTAGGDLGFEGDAGDLSKCRHN